MDIPTRRIEPGAFYRLSEVYRTPGAPGLLPFGKTWVAERVSSGQLPVRKVGRATLVRGEDLLKQLEA